jgi:hypothetical protein
MSTQIDRLTELAKEDPKRQFYSIAHMVTPEAVKDLLQPLSLRIAQNGGKNRHALGDYLNDTGHQTG